MTEYFQRGRKKNSLLFASWTILCIYELVNKLCYIEFVCLVWIFNWIYLQAGWQSFPTCSWEILLKEIGTCGLTDLPRPPIPALQYACFLHLLLHLYKRDMTGGKKQDKNMHALLQACQIKDKHQTKGIHNNIQTLNLWHTLFSVN